MNDPQVKAMAAMMNGEAPAAGGDSAVAPEMQQMMQMMQMMSQMGGAAAKPAGDGIDHTLAYFE